MGSSTGSDTAPAAAPGALRTWAGRRSPAVVASVAWLVLGMDYVVLWPGLRSGRFDVFLAPSDLWGSYLGSVALVHGHFQAPFLGMVGSLAVLAPVAALGNALHLEVGPDFSAFAAPSAWLLVGPWVLALSSVALFAFDAAAERLGASRRRRLWLALAEAALLSNVTVKWGHPEDAVALGLAVFALLDVDRGRTGRGGWLLGAAVAVQPLAVLALPAAGLLVAGQRRGRGGLRSLAALAARAVAPYGVLLVGPLVADGGQTVRWLFEQPNWPALNHATPFTSLAAAVPGSPGAVTAGPARLVAIALSATGAVALRNRATVVRPLGPCLWLAAGAFAVWVAGETVADAYYTWPALALALLLSSTRSWRATGLASATGLFATWFSNQRLPGPWAWWAVVIAILATVLVVAWPRPSASAGPARDRSASDRPAGAAPGELVAPGATRARILSR